MTGVYMECITGLKWNILGYLTCLPSDLWQKCSKKLANLHLWNQCYVISEVHLSDYAVTTKQVFFLSCNKPTDQLKEIDY